METEGDWIAILPQELISKAYVSSNEVAWGRADALRVLAILERSGRCVLGVDVWSPAKPGPTVSGKFVYDWDRQQHDPRFRTAGDFVKNFQRDPTDAFHQEREPYFNLTI
jgi:hypothetical protein